MDQIRAAFKVASLRWHPDKPGGSEEAMRKVVEARDVLCDVDMRWRYDNYGPDGISSSHYSHYGSRGPRPRPFEEPADQNVDHMEECD